MACGTFSRLEVRKTAVPGSRGMLSSTLDTNERKSISSSARRALNISGPLFRVDKSKQTAKAEREPAILGDL